MIDITTRVDDSTETPPRTNEFRRFLRVFLSRKVVIFGAAIILILIITAIFAPLIAPL
jgi:ABC-type antimicrobial peptide transport system permease subunit